MPFKWFMPVIAIYLLTLVGCGPLSPTAPVAITPTLPPTPGQTRAATPIYPYELWEHNMQLRASKGNTPTKSDRPRRKYLLTGIGALSGLPGAYRQASWAARFNRKQRGAVLSLCNHP